VPNLFDSDGPGNREWKLLAADQLVLYAPIDLALP
jgi:hypothetical protein